MNSIDIVFFLWGIVHVVLCPYGKVEESFNLQACHDLMYHGSNLENYDHLQFPGVVPRTFLGSIVLSGLAYPGKWIVDYFDLPKLYSQLAIRFTLVLLVTYGLTRMKRSITRQFGSDTAMFFTLISFCQFHLVFYLGRTLPNIFALLLVILAYSHWIEGEIRSVIIYFSITTVIFRGDTAVLFAPVLVSLLIRGQLEIKKMILWGTSSAIGALLLTIVVDSFFWKRLVWPEGEVLWFNTVENKSHQWGTHPFFWYFYSALPRAMLGTIFLLPLGTLKIAETMGRLKQRIFSFRIIDLVEMKMLQLVLPVLMYLLLFSFLPHKELRFIFNAIPILNLASASGLAKLYRMKPKTIQPFLGGMGVLFASFAISFIFLGASYFNYPGGVAFSRLHEIAKQDANRSIFVHIDNAAAISGVSRFGERFQMWRYDKNETLETLSDFKPFDYLLTEKPFHSSKKDFQVMDVVRSFKAVHWKTIETQDYIYIMKKKLLS